MATFSWRQVSPKTLRQAPDCGLLTISVASYIKGYEIATDGRMGKDLTPDKQPGKSPKDGHKY